MAYADYQIHVIHPTTGATVDIISGRRILGLTYIRKLNTFGEFTLTLSGNFTQNNALFNRLDYLYEIYRRNEPNRGFVFEELYLARYFETFYSDDQEFIIIGGNAFIELLDKYVIIPDNDPAGANGFSTKGGAGVFADTVIQEYVDEQCVSPSALGIAGIPGLTTAPTTNLGLSTLQRRSGERVLEVIKEIADVSAVDYQITRPSGLNFLFSTLTIGLNRTRTSNYPLSPFVYFQLQRRNLLNNRLTIDRRNEITQAIVQAQGPEEDRVQQRVSSARQFDSPFNNRYATTDARELENNTSLSLGLQTAGNAFLAESAPLRSLTFEVDQFASGARYNIDWSLGDTVTAEYKGVEEDYRIIEVQVEIDDATETIKPVLDIV